MNGINPVKVSIFFFEFIKRFGKASSGMYFKSDPIETIKVDLSSSLFIAR